MPTTTIRYVWTDADHAIAHGAKKEAWVQWPYVTCYYILVTDLPACEEYGVGDEITIDLAGIRAKGRAGTEPFRARFHDGDEAYEWHDLKIPAGVENMGQLIDHMLEKPGKYPARIYDKARIGIRSPDDPAKMLFDYWENTHFRAGIVKPGAGFDWKTYWDDPGKLPVHKNGLSLAKVLRKVKRPKPVPVASGKNKIAISERAADAVEAYIRDLERTCASILGIAEAADDELQMRFAALAPLNALHVLGDALEAGGAEGPDNYPPLAQARGNVNTLLDRTRKVINAATDLVRRLPPSGLHAQGFAARELDRMRHPPDPRAHSTDADPKAIPDPRSPRSPEEKDLDALKAQRLSDWLKGGQSAPSELEWLEKRLWHLLLDSEPVAKELHAWVNEAYDDLASGHPAATDLAARLSNAKAKALQVLGDSVTIDPFKLAERLDPLLDKMPEDLVPKASIGTPKAPLDFWLRVTGKGAKTARYAANTAVSAAWVYGALKFTKIARGQFSVIADAHDSQKDVFFTNLNGLNEKLKKCLPEHLAAEVDKILWSPASAAEKSKQLLALRNKVGKDVSALELGGVKLGKGLTPAVAFFGLMGAVLAFRDAYKEGEKSGISGVVALSIAKEGMGIIQHSAGFAVAQNIIKFNDANMKLLKGWGQRFGVVSNMLSALTGTCKLISDWGHMTKWEVAGELANTMGSAASAFAAWATLESEATLAVTLCSGAGTVLLLVSGTIGIIVAIEKYLPEPNQVALAVVKAARTNATWQTIERADSSIHGWMVEIEALCADKQKPLPGPSLAPHWKVALAKAGFQKDLMDLLFQNTTDWSKVVPP